MYVSICSSVYKYVYVCVYTQVKYYNSKSCSPNHRAEMWISIKLKHIQNLEYSSTHYKGESWLQSSDRFQKVQGIFTTKALV